MKESKDAIISAIELVSNKFQSKPLFESEYHS